MKKYHLIITFFFINILCFANSIQTEFITEYGKIWGFLKYYHPYIQKGKVDWDSVFLEKYQLLGKDSSLSNYQRIINDFKSELGPVKKLSKPYKYLKTDSIVYNLDFKWVSSSNLLNPELKQWLFSIIENYKPRKSVYFNNENTNYGYSHIMNNWSNYCKKYHRTPTITKDEAMLSLFKYWNRINYCFAYKNLLESSWESTLTEFVPKILNATPEEASIILVDLTSRIHDCHGTFRSPITYKYYNRNLPSVDIRYAEGKTIIANIHDSISTIYKLNRGDIIDSINNLSTQEYRMYLKKFTGCSTERGVIRNQNYHLLFSKYNDTITYTLTDSLGDTKKIKVNYIKDLYKKTIEISDSSYKPYKIIDGKYCYFNNALMNKKSLREAFKESSNYKAIIIDNRRIIKKFSLYNYTRFLKWKPNSTFCQYYKMDRKFPGIFNKSSLIYKPFYIQYPLQFLNKKFSRPVIILVNEHTQSTMEFQTMWAKIACDAIIIGTPTAGADGAKKNFIVNPFLGASYTEGAVFWPDGGQTQRIGVVPDIIVDPTIESIRQGKDEILLKAIEYLEKNQPVTKCHSQ